MHIPFVQDYWIGRTYVHDSGADRPLSLPPGIHLRAVDPDDLAAIAASSDPDLSKRRAPVDAGCRRYGAWRDDGAPIGLCTFSFGAGYSGYYELGSKEAELSDIFTVRQCRGMGIASLLIQYGTCCMHELGFARLYAKIWHNNLSSIKAFEKAGWRNHSFFVRVQPAGTSHSIRLRWPL